MGVTGLWRLIEPAGKPVPVETLENKVLAVDISIWLHQMVKGYQDAKGAPLPNAHLMGLFQRLCKLLYFRIKPVFVFDGGFPDLKNETIARRQNHKAKYNSESERIKREITLLLGKKTAIGSLLGKQISPKKSDATSFNDPDDLFKLPALPQKEESESESDEEESSSSSIADLHSIDLESESFKQLPMKEKYDLLIELKETRKMNSWGKLHELPKKSDSFSDFQMQRLLKRRKVQEHLEETEKEMGSTGMSICELETLLNEEGIDTKIESLPSRRIASDNNTRFLLINNVKQALADAKKKKEAIENPSSSITETKPDIEDKIDELEDDLQKAIKMSMECVDDPDTSACTTKTDDSWTSIMTDSDVYSTDSEEEDGYEEPSLSTAKAYIMQYCDFTHKAINEIVAPKVGKIKTKVSTIDNILNEINLEKSIVADKVELSSDDDEGIQSSGNHYEINEEMKSSIHNSSIALDFAENHATEATQNSVIRVESSENSITSLNTNVDCFQSNSNDFDKIKKESSIDDLPTAENHLIDSTQNSVIHIENSEKSVISLDTSNDEEFYQSLKNESKISYDGNIEENSLSSSDEEFEEVPNDEIKNTKVVEVTLNVGSAPEDDIFADVFELPQRSESLNMIEKKTEVTANTGTDNNVAPATKNVVDTINIENTAKMSDIDFKEVSPPKNKDITMINTDATKDVHSSHLKVVNDTQKPKSVTNNVPNVPKESITNEKLQSMADEIQNSEQDLLKEKGRLDRIGRNITHEMTKEAQELLQLFGIPYVIAPMEAEAQCAFLENVNLTDGTITDDSDIWLFGGRTVYKNFFNQKKHVLQFLSERIEKSFNLTREQLILLALLVGSDYTTGVSGVGPVTALEILASFPFNKKHLENETSKHAQYAQIITGLKEFKQWVRAGKRTDNTNLKKKLRNVKLTDDFPSVRVVQAYMEPNVEKNEDKFTWGEIDLTVLRDYTKDKFGWSQNKLDEVMKPVMKRILERKSQKTVQDFFKRKIEFQSLEDQMSKRVKVAVQKMGADRSAENDIIEELQGKSKPKARKRKVKKLDDEAESNTNSNLCEAGPSNTKVAKSSASKALNMSGVKIVSEVIDGKSEIDIKIMKSDRYQEIIPQREKDKQSLLQNKMKAIELFRKTTIDRKRQTKKRKPVQPKDEAELSESSDSN